jgi:NADH-quinone oxidoreductase subunit J
MEGSLFYFCGAMMIFGAVAMVTSRRAMAAGGWLALALAGAAGLFATLHAPFLAVLQIMVHAGAIMAPFALVIMMVGKPAAPPRQQRDRFRATPRPWLLSAVALALAAVWLRSVPPRGFSAALPGGFGEPARVSLRLMSDYLPVLGLAAVLLLVAMVGVLALVRSGRGRPWS